MAIVFTARNTILSISKFFYLFKSDKRLVVPRQFARWNYRKGQQVIKTVIRDSPDSIRGEPLE